MEAISSSSVFFPTFQQSHSPTRSSYLRLNLSFSKSTCLAAASRQVSGDADNGDQQLHLHNALDFVTQQPESSSSSSV